MASNVIFSFKNPEVPKSRAIKVTQDGKIIDLSKIEANQYDDQRKDCTSSKEQQLKSIKSINLNRVLSHNQENKESREKMLEKELRLAQSYHEEEMNKLVLTNKLIVQELEIKNRVLDKERNHWKELALKLKSEIESKGLGENMEKEGFYESVLSENKMIEEEVSKYKLINTQLISDLTKLKQENKRLIDQLHNHSKESHSLTRIDTHHKPRIFKVHTNLENYETEDQTHSEVKHHHRRHRHNESSMNGNIEREAQKEIEKLKKVCFLLEKVISERNEELMIEKTKVLNIKYKND